MSTQAIAVPFPIIPDIDGQPLENGDIYIGTAGLNAVTNQIQVYFDTALSVAASQPISTRGGFPINASGAITRIYVDATDYSMSVLDKNGAATQSSLNITERISSEALTYKSTETGSVNRTVADKLYDFICVKDFGPVGDGVTDDTVVVQAALDAAMTKQVPLLIDGTYAVTNVNLNSFKAQTNKVCAIQGFSNADNYQDADNNSTLVALTTTPVLTLDISNSGAATRFTVKLKNFNVFSTNAAWGGIRAKHAWFYADGVSVKTCQYGINLEESYRSSITNCALTYNTYGLFFQGFNSVSYIVGNQIRGNSTAIGFDGSYTPTADTSANAFEQCSVKGNNVETCPTVFDFSNSQCRSASFEDNYVEGGTTLLDLTGSNTHKNVTFRGSAIGYTLTMDKCIGVYLHIDQGSVTTTDDSQDVFVEKSDTFANLFIPGILTVPRIAVTTDSFFETASIVSSLVFLPREYINSTISAATEMTWYTADTWKNNPVLRCKDTETGDYLRLSLPLKEVTANPYESYAYRLRCCIVYKCLSGGFDVSRQFSTDGGFSAISTQSATDWTEYKFTLDVPDTANDINLQLDFDTGDDVLIAGIVVSYVENPLYQNTLEIFNATGIAQTTGLTLTCTEQCWVSVTPPDGTDNYYVENNGTTAPVVKHSGTGTKTAMINIAPIGIRRV